MSRIGKGQMPRRQLQDAEPDCNEHLLVVAAQFIVRHDQCGSRIAQHHHARFQDRQGARHEQCGTYALARHIRHCYDKMVVIQHIVVVEVAADLLCRCHTGEDVENFPLR